MHRLHRPESVTTAQIRLSLAVMAFVAGGFFCLSDASWHNQATFYYLNQLPIPWWVYGIAFLSAGICLCFCRTRPIGYLIGAILYSFFGVAVWLAVIGGLHSHSWLLHGLNFPAGKSGNPFAAVNITSIAIIYWVVLKDAIGKQVDPDKDKLNQ